MNFVHDEPGFASLLTQVADQTRIAPALVEKDYWITHALWALHETGLDLWFKGGTSLSKGFALIERFSEDLDLMVEPGRVTALPEVSSWTSLNKGPVAQRLAFYRALAEAFVIPAVPLDRDATREDKCGRGADYLGRYPGVFVANLPGAMSPSVRFEIGRARVVPFVERHGRHARREPHRSRPCASDGGEPVDARGARGGRGPLGAPGGVPDPPRRPPLRRRPVVHAPLLQPVRRPRSLSP